jgi:hypothetical protein
MMRASDGGGQTRDVASRGLRRGDDALLPVGAASVSGAKRTGNAGDFFTGCEHKSML